MLLPPSFYARPALDVAYDLIGAIVRCNGVAVRITEVEAYEHTESASHCYRGKTKRNAPLWGPPGHLYVYLCYGIHNLVNISTDTDGVGSGVLLRSASALEGEDLLLERRGKTHHTDQLLAGPGNVGQGLNVDRTWSHTPVFTPGGFEIHRGTTPSTLRVGPRVGIGYATKAHQALPWRIAAPNTQAVTHAQTLKPQPYPT